MNAWSDQEYFVISDASYDRIHRKLKNGSRFEWSFATAVCEKDAQGKCICPKMMNVLKDHKIIRIANGKQKPVYRASDFLQNDAKVTEETVAMNIYMKGMTHNAQHYVEHLKEQINLFSSNGVGGFNVKIYLDCEGWSGDAMAFYVSSQEKDKLISTVEGLPMRLQMV